MIPAASAAGVAVKTAQPVATLSAERASQPQAPETARASAGESSAANIRLETTKAVTAPEQTAVAPRLRDQETAERSERALPANDTPTGPPPTFEESPLERQVRVAFDPPEPEAANDAPAPAAKAEVRDTPEDLPELTVSGEAPPADPPPTPAEKAEASFAETRTMSKPHEPSTVNVTH